jgi:hypothetical protein
LDYDGSFWPGHIENTTDPDTCEWLSKVLNFVPLQPRPEGYNPLLRKNLEPDLVKKLGVSGKNATMLFRKKDVKKLGESMKETFFTWSKMLPYTVPRWVMKEMETNYFPKLFRSDYLRQRGRIYRFSIRRKD